MESKEGSYRDKGHKMGYLWVSIDYKWHNDAFWNTGKLPYHEWYKKKFVSKSIITIY